LAIRISEIAKPVVKDVATSIDQLGNKDGIVTPDEIALERAKLQTDKTGWDDSREAALVDIETFMTQSSGLATPDVSGDLTRLADCQRTVLQKMEEHSKPLSDGAHAALLARVQRLGYSEADLTKTLEYIRTKAPLNVNFQPDKLTSSGKPLVDSFLGDASYRNQYETKISSGRLDPVLGGQRDGWEKNLFLGIYHSVPFNPAERPKYGTMNPARNATGGANNHYGDCHFVLKPGIRDRATFTPFDSGARDASVVGTADHFEHILNQYQPDGNIKAIMDVALGRADHRTVQTYPYIEAQIHGPLDFAKDVAEVVVDVRYKGTAYEAKLREFCSKNNLPLHWNDQMNETADLALWK
jgi:hypothetical protein